MSDATEFLNRPVDVLEDMLPGYDGDLQDLLEAEKNEENRKTAKQAIKNEMERRSTGEKEEGMNKLKQDIKSKLEERDRRDSQEQTEETKTDWGETHFKTGVPGFDKLFRRGIPKGAPVLVAGGAGSGKTILCLQTLAHHAAKGENCFYMSFEESAEKLKKHMRDFGWEPDELEEQGTLNIEQFSPFDITRQVEAMLAEEQGELLIDVEPVLLPTGFQPDFVVIDSLTALASAFSGEQSSYRIYIEQLFRFFEERNITTFMISETGQEPETFSPTGVEEFLADGVVVLYNFRRGDVRERAVEVLKMRGESHERNIVAMQITDQGIRVYPEQEVFSAMS